MRSFKTKITTQCRDFVFKKPDLLHGRFGQRLDALGAQHLVHRATLLHHERLLQVRFVRAVCSTLGERAIVTESR